MDSNASAPSGPNRSNRSRGKPSSSKAQSKAQSSLVGTLSSSDTSELVALGGGIPFRIEYGPHFISFRFRKAPGVVPEKLNEYRAELAARPLACVSIPDASVPSTGRLAINIDCRLIQPVRSLLPATLGKGLALPLFFRVASGLLAAVQEIFDANLTHGAIYASVRTLGITRQGKVQFMFAPSLFPYPDDALTTCVMPR